MIWEQYSNTVDEKWESRLSQNKTAEINQLWMEQTQKPCFKCRAIEPLIFSAVLSGIVWAALYPFSVYIFTLVNNHRGLLMMKMKIYGNIILITDFERYTFVSTLFLPLLVITNLLPGLSLMLVSTQLKTFDGGIYIF